MVHASYGRIRLDASLPMADFVNREEETGQSARKGMAL
jgi:hypothetical protein